MNDCLRSQPIDILIVSPNFGNYFDVLRFKESPIGKGNQCVIALVSTFIDASVLSKYDDSISVYDDLEVISNKISRLQNIELMTIAIARKH